MKDISHIISEDELTQVCPLCDNEITDPDLYDVVFAHGSLQLVHLICLQEAEEEAPHAPK